MVFKMCALNSSLGYIQGRCSYKMKFRGISILPAEKHLKTAFADFGIGKGIKNEERQRIYILFAHFAIKHFYSNFQR
jgi:hypothetical protein